MGTPSTTNKGWFVPEKEFSPRTTIREVDPTPAPPLVMVTPAIFPDILLIRLGSGALVNSLVLRDCTAYPSDLAGRVMPSAVTTTSLIDRVSLSRAMVTADDPAWVSTVR